MIGAPDIVTSQSLVSCVSCKLLEELIDHPRVGHQEGKSMSALSNCFWLVVCYYSSFTQPRSSHSDARSLATAGQRHLAVACPCRTWKV